MRPHRRAALLILPLWLAALPTRAADTPSGKPWRNETEFSFVSANGNTKSTTISGKDKLTYTRGKTTVDLFGGGLGAKSGGTVIAEQYNAGSKVSYKITDRNYGFEKFQWDKDRFSGIKSRYDTALGLGREFLDLPSDKVIGEAGFGYIREYRIHSKDEAFATARLYSKYEHVISPTANFTQDGELVFNLEDSEDIRAKTETALIAALSAHLSLKVSYVWKYVGEPPASFGHSDTLTSVSLIAVY
jgi:putative salt-induced outer membrane protein